jgi:hypothetical protein
MADTEPAAHPDGQYPRLNASLLHTHKYVGKIISLVGCVESFDGTIVSLRCADGAIVPVLAQQAEFHQPTGTFVELVGFVNEDHSVSVRCSVFSRCSFFFLFISHTHIMLFPLPRLSQLFVTRVLSNDFNLDVYNQMITQVQHNPKFAQYFHPVATKY